MAPENTTGKKELALFIFYTSLTQLQEWRKQNGNQQMELVNSKRGGEVLFPTYTSPLQPFRLKEAEAGRENL